MALWTLLVWLGVGALAGLITRHFMGGQSPFGIVGDAILGISGGIVGGYLLALAGMGNTAGGLLATIATAVVGASLLVWSTRYIRKHQ